jgi:hypothetical protein
MGNILAKKIAHNEHIVFGRPGLSSITGSLINNTPTKAWLRRNHHYSEGDEALELTFEEPEDLTNTIHGVYIQVGPDGILIDGEVEDVNDKLNGCCGQNAEIVQNYPTGLPAYQAPVAKTYTLVRDDDGTMGAASDALFAYSANERGGNVLPNSFKTVSRNNGTNKTTYTFQAYRDPSAQGTDVITETAIVIESNVYATALAGSNVYQASGSVDGEEFSVKGTAATLASLVVNLNADAVAKTFGTWTAGANKVVLTTTVKDAGNIALGQVAP